MNAIASGFRADIENGIADTARLTKKDLVLFHYSERECIDERIERVSIIESDFAANSGHAKCVAVMRNAANHAGQQRTIAPPVLWMVQRSKSQTVHRGNRPRTHGKHVAQNAADTRGRA